MPAGVPHSVPKAALESQQYSMNQRYKKDVQLIQAIEASFSKQKKSLDQGTFLAGGSIDSVEPRISVEEACKWMIAKGRRVVLVFDGNEVGGMFDLRTMLGVVADGVDVKRTQVGQVMVPMPVAVQEGIQEVEALAIMSKCGVSMVPVMEGESFIGCLGVEELALRNVESLTDGKSIASLINAIEEPEALLTVDSKASTVEVCRLLTSQQSHNCLVMDSDKMVGILSSWDILLRVVGAGLDPRNTSTIRIMTPSSMCVYPDYDIMDVFERLRNGEQCVPVMDYDGSIVALVDLPMIIRGALRLAGVGDEGLGAMGEGGSRWMT